MGLNLSNLKPAKGATKKKKRIGRGQASGQGKQAGRGHNGQKSRSGYSRRLGFEGGQMPLIRRVPKRGFSNYPFRVRYAEVNVGRLNELAAGTEVTPELLKELRIVRKMLSGVKILGNGELKVGLTIRAHKFTQSAIEKIEAAGGTVIEIKREAATPSAPTAEAEKAAPPVEDSSASEDTAGSEDGATDGDES